MYSRIVLGASLFPLLIVLPRRILYTAGYDDAWAALMCVGWSTLPKLDTTGSDSRSGASAGGVLTAWVAQKAANDGPALRLQVLLNPNLDATTSRPRAALRKAFEQNLCIGTFGGRGFKRFACYGHLRKRVA